MSHYCTRLSQKAEDALTGAEDNYHVNDVNVRKILA